MEGLVNKVPACILLVFLGLVLSVPPVVVAHSYTNSAQLTEAQKNSQKSQKRYMKQQKKEQKKAQESQKQAMKSWKKQHPETH